MKMKDMGPLDEVFSHIDDKTGETTHFNITAMSHSWRVRSRPTVFVPVEPDVVQFFLERRGIEEHRVQRLKGQVIETPILVLHWPDGRHLVVDGHHRYVASGLSGAHEIPAKVIPRSVWRKFVIDDMPAEQDKLVLGGFSGIL